MLLIVETDTRAAYRKAKWTEWEVASMGAVFFKSLIKPNFLKGNRYLQAYRKKEGKWPKNATVKLSHHCRSLNVFEKWLQWKEQCQYITLAGGKNNAQNRDYARVMKIIAFDEHLKPQWAYWRSQRTKSRFAKRPHSNLSPNQKKNFAWASCDRSLWVKSIVPVIMVISTIWLLL